MGDVLAALAARALGVAEILQPRLRSPFEGGLAAEPLPANPAPPARHP
jgi:hypothetical protein